MAKENKVEYERVDEEGDKYKRILVKFNPHFLRGSDFEIEFIPILEAYGLGRVFVSKIDSMSTIDLYCWATRHYALTKGGNWERGTIPTIDENNGVAEVHKTMWRKGELDLEPRQIIGQVKRAYEAAAKKISEPTAFALNYFLWSGRLGALPYGSPAFTIDRLKMVINESPYYSKNSNGEMVKRTLIEHLFDTHKTEYVVSPILHFLEEMREIRELIIKKYGEKWNR